MKVKELIIRLLDEPMDAEIMLCTDDDKKVEDFNGVKVVNRGVSFAIDEIEHWNEQVCINFTDWRKNE